MMMITQSFGSKKFRMHLYLGIVSFLLGVIWWYTTGAYQVDLPLDNIEKMRKEVEKLRINFPKKLIFVVDPLYEKKFGGLVVDENDKKFEIFNSIFNEHDDVVSIEERISEHFDGILDEPSEHIVIVRCRCDKDVEEKEIIYMGTKRFSWVNIEDCENLLVDDLNDKFEELFEDSNEELSKGEIKFSQWSENIRFSFHLVIFDPFSYSITWDFESLERSYILPFVRKIREVYPRIVVDSQLLHGGEFPDEPKFDGDKGEYFLGEKEMSFLLNKNPQWKLESMEVHNDISLHFLLLIPSKRYSPFWIRPSKYNAYIIPKMGGVMVHNIDNEVYSNESNIILNEDHLHEQMEVFIGQARKLVGLECKKGVVCLPSRRNGASDWEIDILMRKKIQEYLDKTIHSLSALSEIAQTMPEVNIQRSVKENCVRSLEEVETAITSSGIGDLQKTFHHSRQAVLYAERAFFDPTMDSLLYFSLYQKMAVYLPFLLSFWNILKALIEEIKRRRTLAKLE